MNLINLRSYLLIAAVFAALSFPALSPAQQSGTPPATSARRAQQQSHEQQLLTDFADMARFRDADRELAQPAPGENRVVFMGDSITEGWDLAKSFPGKPYINRGISGQTSPQMLIRFRQDVIDLKPKVVVILAGTNDIAENTGPMTLRQSEGNLASMAQLARANGIRVVLCSVLPSVLFPWHPQVKNVASRIAALNQWIRPYAAQHHYVYVDYYSKMKDAAGGLPKNLSHDGVHPTAAGYAVMAPLAQAGIEKALKETGR